MDNGTCGPHNSPPRDCSSVQSAPPRDPVSNKGRSPCASPTHVNRELDLGHDEQLKRVALRITVCRSEAALVERGVLVIRLHGRTEDSSPTKETQDQSCTSLPCYQGPKQVRVLLCISITPFMYMVGGTRRSWRCAYI